MTNQVGGIAARNVTSVGNPYDSRIAPKLHKRGGGKVEQRIPIALTGGSLEPELDLAVVTSNTNTKLVCLAKIGLPSDSPDVRHGMSRELAKQIEEAWRLKHREDQKQRSISGDEYRAVMPAPLLLLYLLRGTEREPDGDDVSYRGGLVLPALALHFPGAPDPDAPRRLVRYRLNAVAQAELFPVDIDDEGIPDDADPDD